MAKSQARGRSGLEAILRSVLSNQFLGWFARSLEHEAASFTRGKNPVGVVTMGVMSGVTPTLAVRFCPSFLDSGYDGSPSFLDSYRLPTSVEPYPDVCDDDTSRHQHAGVIPLPQQICTVPAFASVNLLGPDPM